MPTLSSNDRFLGVDLGALWREIRRPWSRLHEWPVMSWLTPPVPIRLLQADGGETVWLGEVLQASSKSSGQSFVAVELPLDDVLCRSLVLPQVPDDEVAGAVALEAQGASPFPAADLVWGFRLSPREGGGVRLRSCSLRAGRSNTIWATSLLACRRTSSPNFGCASIPAPPWCWRAMARAPGFGLHPGAAIWPMGCWRARYCWPWPVP